MKPLPKRREITESKVALFKKAEEQLQSFHREIGSISKKKPSEALNKFKLGFINQTLTKANELFGDEYRPFPNFTIFDVEESLWTASDVVMMLDQYLAALNRFKTDHGGHAGWNLPKPDTLDDRETDDDEDDEEEEEDEGDDEEEEDEED